MKEVPFRNQAVKAVFDSYPNEVKKKCMLLRALIFSVAADDSHIGPLEETLKWNEPSYLTKESNSGSMIRLHHHPKKPFDFALYFLCNTTLVASFKEEYGDVFRFGGNRSIEFMLSDTLPINEIKSCLWQAMTYKLPR